MKCIRKDIIIDNEQFDNIKLEKEILFSVFTYHSYNYRLTTPS